MGVVNGQEFYNYYNLGSYVKQCGIKEGSFSFRYLKDFINTKIQMFGYKNLPQDSDLTNEIIESALMFNARLCFYKSETLGLVLCRYIPLGEYDIYWKPIEVELLGLNGVTIKERVPYKDIILFRDNPMDIIPFITLMEYIKKIQNFENTLDVNMQLLKLPSLFVCDKKLKGSVNQLFKAIENFEPFVIADTQLQNSFQQYDINLPISPEVIMSIMKNYKNMALQSIGIYGTDTQKRERLLVGEVQSQNDYVDLVYQGMKEERENTIKQLNEKYGYNIELVELYANYKQEEIDFQKQLIPYQQNGQDNDSIKKDNKGDDNNE